MTTADRRVAANLNGQSATFTRQQARAAVMSDRQLRSRVESGFLEKTGVQSYGTPGRDRSPSAELRALLADIGEPCWASGPTAAALHGFDGFPLRPPFHVTIPRGRSVTRLGHVVHTTAEMPVIDHTEIDGIAVLRPARTIIDLARSSTPAELARAIDSALRDGLISESALHARVVALRTKGRYGVPLLLDVLSGVEVTRGGHSWLEREFLRVAAAAGLPRPVCQEVLARAGERLVRVDARFPASPVVVELLGYRFHRSKAELQRDAERANALMLQGFRPFQFTYEDVVTRPAQVVSTIEAALAGSGSGHTTTDVVVADTDGRPGSASGHTTTDVVVADAEPVGRLRAWWAARPSGRGSAAS